MPRRVYYTTRCRNVLERNVKLPVERIKNKSNFIETCTAPCRRDIEDEQQDSMENTYEVAAQMHTIKHSMPDLSHEETDFRSSITLSNSKVMQSLESSQPELDSSHIEPKINSYKLCLTPALRPDIDDKVKENIITLQKNSESLILSDLSIRPHSTIEVTELDLTHVNLSNATAAHSNSAVYSDLGIINEAVVTYTEPEAYYSSHDPEENIIIEDLAILPDSEQPLDTSTPLGSLSILTIMQNVESDNFSSFNINTPSSSMCVDSPINDNAYIPSSSNETTDKDPSNYDEIQPKQKRKVKKKTDLGRIRKVNKSAWIDTKRKLLKNQGLDYVSRNGKTRSGKSILPPCGDDCRLKCKEKIEEEVRKQLFKQYWSLGDRERQWDFLVRWCKRIGNKRFTTEGPSKRLFSVNYCLPKVLVEINDERVTVCKKMFLHTFAIGEGVVRTALKKLTDGDGLVLGFDERGRHHNHYKVKTDEMVKSVSDHVKSFTPVESHYTRKESSKLYLDSELTMTKMFKLYNEWVAETETNRANTLRQYTDIVNENFNIEFHRPKKDQCDVCIAYKNQLKPVNQDIQEQYNAHLQNKDMARRLKNEDKLAAINSPSTTVTAAFDFQKVHSSPHAETSILYYKRKLNVFNFTIFELGQKVGKCYMWHEGTAKRGANEVASCVYDFIKYQSSKGIQTINLYSDNCGGQNRNRIVFVMYLVAAKQFNVNITHRFLEKGHTQNENDSVHALIERCSKNKEIYTPDQWFALIRWAKETGNPYIVKEVAKEDILDFKKLLIGKNWTKDNRNLKVMWSNIREIHVSSSESDVLNYKYTFEETYHRIFVKRTQNRRRQNPPDYEMSQAYTAPLPISKEKLADLKYLCEHNVIPRQYHGFYHSLATSDVIVSTSDEDE